MIINSSSNLYGNEGLTPGVAASAQVAGATSVSASADVFDLYVLGAALVAGAKTEIYASAIVVEFVLAAGNVDGATSVSASADVFTFYLYAAALVAGSTSVSASGEIVDLNVTGAAIVAGSSEIAASGARASVGGANVEGKTTIVAEGARSLGSSDAVVITARILPEPSSSPFINQTARLSLNGSVVGIKSFLVTARPDSVGYDVEVELADPRLATLALATQDIIFELGMRATPGGAIVWEKIVEVDAINRHSYRTAFAGRSLSISLASGLADKLARAPIDFLTVYDPDRATVDFSTTEPLAIEGGGAIAFNVSSAPVLSLYDILALFAEKCGFAGYQTNIENHQIERVDFSPLETYLDSIRGLLGLFEPFIFEREGKVVFLEPTSALPSGFDPLDLTSAEFTEYEHELEIEPLLPGFLVNFEQTKTTSTFYVDRTVTPPSDEVGDYGSPGYTRTDYETRFRDYYRTGETQKLKTELLKEKRTTIGATGATIARETETHALDAQGRRKSTTVAIEALVPVLNGSSSTALLNVKTEKINYTYTPDPENPGRYIISKKTTETSGLIAIDSENQYLDLDFEQSIVDAHKAGNLNADMSTRYGALKTTTELLTKLGGGQAQTKISIVDHLANTKTNSLSDVKVGEVSVGGFESKPGRLVVYRDDVGTLTGRGKLENFSLGALPLSIGLPLAKRRLKARVEGRRKGSVSFRGFDYYLRRGATYRVLDREGALMNCLVLGYAITGENLGTKEQRISTRLDVAEIG